LKNAPILILDEATSALDTQTEQYIQSSFDELMQ
jgi:ATP-binding cassette subfamily B protein